VIDRQLILAYEQTEKETDEPSQAEICRLAVMARVFRISPELETV